ncbi:MAG: DUF4386 domain-containing protein [Caldilineaceae bacterium]|nr:DUF4386 domain-containing protein [Caldilineaceae bacterium]
MKTERKTAVMVGVLFFAATTASLLGSALTGSILDAPDYLAGAAANGNQVIFGALLIFLAAAGSSGIAIALYPVLKKQNEGLAIGSVGFRLIEGAFYIVDALCLAAVVVVSHHAVSAGGQNATTFQVIGDLLLAIGDLAGFVFAVFAFCLGGLMYYFIFYQTKLVPRWLSVWGIIALVLLLAAVLFTLFDGEPYSVSGNLVYLALPIALQELVLALWLIVKGFNPSVIAVGLAKA